MKNGLLLLLCLTVFQANHAQLNCKTIVDGSQSNVKKCFHANKKVSTSETWDEANRFGTLQVYNNQGKELAVYSLRSVGGHASAHLEFFPNGQVSIIDFSDAPDGGIQFYNSTRRFDENGNQVEFHEMKYPFELETTFIQSDPKEMPEQTLETPQKQEVIACATIFQTIYQLQNTTNSKMIILVEPLPNNAVSVTEKEIILQPHQSIAFDTLIMADQFISEKVYQPILKNVLTKKRKSKKINIIQAVPVDNATVRTCIWFIIEQ